MVRGNKGSGNVAERDEWQTPQWLFDKLDEQYTFTFDCCANDENSKCNVWSCDFLDYDDFYEDDKSWMNPPFSKALHMFDHFFNMVGKGVCIFRCDNMETKLWQEVILKNATWIFIPNKRINYEGMKGGGSVFPSALIGYNVEPPKSIEGTTLFMQRDGDK